MNTREARLIPDGLPTIFRAADDYRVERISNLILFEYDPNESDEAAMLAADVADYYDLQPDDMQRVFELYDERVHA